MEATVRARTCAVDPPGAPSTLSLGLLGTVRWVLAGCALWIALQYSDDPTCLVINSGLLLLPWLALCAATGRWQASLGFAALLAIGLYALGEYKFAHFGERQVAGDLPVVADVQFWRLAVHEPLLQPALQALIALVALLAIDAMAQARTTPPLGAVGRVAALLVGATLAGFCYQHRHEHQWQMVHDDADCGDLHRCGVLARMVFSTAVLELEPTAPAASWLLPASAEAATPSALLPDLVVWLNAATIDPRQLALPGAELPRLRMFESNGRTIARGQLHAPGSAGAWPAGAAPVSAAMPERGHGGVFERVPPRVSSALLRLLKQQGYHTVALLPYPKRFYGAAGSYAVLGVDEVLTLRDFPEYAALPGDEWDLADSPRLAQAALTLIRRFHAGAPRQPLFLYLASTREAGPYTATARPGFGLSRAGLPPLLARQLSDYVTRLRLLDDAVTALDRGLASLKQPAVFCWFGDRAPDFGGAALPWRSGSTAHVTPFQVTANYPAPRETLGGAIDVALLPSLLVDLSGVRRDRLFSAMSGLRRLCSSERSCGELDFTRGGAGLARGVQVSLR